MHVCSDFAEVVLDLLKHRLELLLSCMSEQFLTEEVGNLVHHELVEGTVLRAKQLRVELFDELALLGGIGLLLLHLEDFFVDLVLEELEAALVLGKELGLLDQELRSLIGTLETLEVAEGLGKGQLQVVLVGGSVLRGHRRVVRRRTDLARTARATVVPPVVIPDGRALEVMALGS